MPEACSLPEASAVLCEHCGYRLDGLFIDGTGKCPECGTPISVSTRGGHPGSPVQRRMNYRAWLRTGWMVLRSPGPTFDRLVLGRHGAGELHMANWLLGGGLIAIKPMLLTVGAAVVMPEAGEGRVIAVVAVPLVVIACEVVYGLALGVLFLILTGMCGGVARVVASVYTWRWSGRIASAVSSHAGCAVSVAWGIVSVAELPFAAVWLIVNRHHLDFAQLRGLLLGIMAAEFALATAAVACYTLVGAHRLRFANAC